MMRSIRSSERTSFLSALESEAVSAPPVLVVILEIDAFDSHRILESSFAKVSGSLLRKPQTIETQSKWVKRPVGTAADESFPRSFVSTLRPLGRRSRCFRVWN